METQDALGTIDKFKDGDLKKKLDELKVQLLGKGIEDIPVLTNEYNAALKVKEISAQINEVVHATGIINCLHSILEQDEIVRETSLASGAAGKGIDLVTNMRIAEFKFSKWQEGSSNGTRRRQIFKDMVQLYMNPSSLKKELYVVDSDMVLSFLNSKKAQWKNVLSKSGGLDIKLEKYLKEHEIEDEITTGFIFNLANVEVFDIDLMTS